MARVPYQPFQSELPADRPPPDYFSVQANPAETGGLIAQGLEKFGQGATQAGKFFGQVQTDAMVNEALKEGDAAVSQFKTLRGQDALNAQAGLNKNLDDIINSRRGTLGTPEQQLQFDNTIRPYRDRYWAGQISTHADTEGKFYTAQTNGASFELAHSMAATAGDQSNEATLAVARAKAFDAQYKNLQASGLANNPDALARANQMADSVYKTYAETLAVKNPVAAEAFIDRHQKELSYVGANGESTYTTLKNQFKTRIDDAKAEGAANTAIHMATQGQGQRPVGQVTDSAAMLRQQEGFRSNAYWDVNHWRTGYGSDTITLPDGSVQPVTATTTVTHEDAERDLARRIQQSQGQIVGSIGQDAWNKLSPQAKVSLTSVTYNYGHLPGQLVAAAQSGDPQRIASAIASLPSNSRRRQQEAANVLGRFTLQGPGGTTTPQPTMQSADNVVQFPSGEPTEQPPAPEQAAFSPTPSPAPIETPEEFEARSIQNLSAMDLTDAQFDKAYQKIRRKVAELQAGAAMTAAAVKARKDAAQNDVDGFMLKGDLAGAMNYVKSSPQLDNHEKLTMLDAIRKRASEEGNIDSYGPNYNDYLKRIIAPGSDPARIASPVDIYAGEAKGELTRKDADELIKVLGNTKKSTTEVGDQKILSAGLDDLKKRLTYEDSSQPFSLKDPRGAELLPGATALYIGQYQLWKDAGKDLSSFPLFDPKKMDQFIELVRPKRQMELDKLNAQFQQSGQDEPAPSPAPRGVDQQMWNQTITNRPIAANGQPIPMLLWDRFVGRLAANPKIEAPIWDRSQFGKAGWTAERILGQLGVHYDKTPGRPENVEPGQPVQSPAAPTPPFEPPENTPLGPGVL